MTHVRLKLQQNTESVSSSPTLTSQIPSTMSHFFVDTFEQDNRQPLFEVPWVIEGHKLAFFGFDYLFWLYSFALLTVQACVNLPSVPHVE